jgi:hypothetical protein
VSSGTAGMHFTLTYFAIVLKRVEFLQRSAATVDQQQNKKILAANSRTNVEQERWLHELEAKFEGSVARKEH